MPEFHPTDLTCPECRGPISEFSQEGIKEFRCRVGHRYAPETFLVSLSETRERALWAAVVVLEEGADVAKELAGRVTPAIKSRYEQEAKHNAKAAATIRDLLIGLNQDQSRHLLKQKLETQLLKDEPHDPNA